MRVPHQVWGKLRITYQCVSEAAIDGQLTRFQQIQMNRAQSIVEYSNRFDAICNERSSVGHNLSELERKRSSAEGIDI